VRQDGVLSRQQAIDLAGRSVVRNRLAQGHWQRPARGVVVTHSGPVTDRQRLWIAVLGAGEGAVCAGLTAATLQGLRGYRPTAIEILVPISRQVASSPGIVVRRASTLPREHLHRNARPPRTTLARGIVDAAAWATCDDDARAIVAAAFQQRLIVDFELAAVLTALPRSRRRSLVEETATLATRGAHAISELALVRICRRFGLPAPDHQVRRIGADGRSRYLDAYWQRWRLHVEVDGAWHLEVRSWWADMRRQNAVWIAGVRVLRFPAWVVLHRPEEVAAQLRAALLAAGWRPGAD